MLRLFVALALFASLEFSAFAQGRMAGPENNFDVILKQGGIMDLHTLEEVDRNLRNQVATRSEANLSKLDLKAPGRARREYSKGLAAFLKKTSRLRPGASQRRFRFIRSSSRRTMLWGAHTLASGKISWPCRNSSERLSSMIIYRTRS